MTAVIDTFIAPPCHEKIDILFQDESILLINKPSGLLSLSGKNPLNKDSVHYRLVQQFPTALMVHRLDFGTSGVMVVALNKAVNAELTKQFQARTIVKHYVSVLEGHLRDDEGEISFPIAKNKAHFPLQKICMQTGKSAISHFRVLARLQNPLRTRVGFMPVTGRTHQLRVHSEKIGHPILGCDLYGNEGTHAMASRLLLHATRLEFDHPITAERMVGTCEAAF
ncbi:RluA family pseudouridine synthase [Shewanella surugensis]|uniref:RluA family pseudouridine synthase n=1 Tax=Shewanella surugensis TaxID=212020 RepID=A0ABT0LHY0_9GAMM|nr:RluA family pseudouridine synthase [Shewanella surugensis]MCL1126912.1 RluA family pseudouridine synthase [Shewanella surugensis]